MTRRAPVVLLIAILALLFASLAIDYTERLALPALAQRYLTLVPHELGVPNSITGLLLTYRGLDTLGEVAVLFMVAAGAGLVLGAGNRPSANTAAEEAKAMVPPTEFVQNGARLLFPLLSIFAAYIIMNGHLSAGGGFQGGAVIASGVSLLLLARPDYVMNIAFLSVTESVAGVLFVLVGIAGVIFAGGFLDSRILPLGQFGAFLSAGAIPILSALLGIKVGCELSVIIDKFRRHP